jgi:hypothetical protein
MNQNRRRKQFVCELGCSGKDNSICGRFLLAEYAKSTNGHSMTQQRILPQTHSFMSFRSLKLAAAGLIKCLLKRFTQDSGELRFIFAL